jgi:hypothetical protein
MPDDVQEMANHLASTKFGQAYKPERGVVSFASSRGHLAAKWADIPQRVADHPDVRFFLEKNPGYAHGDELVCLTELNERNLRSYALRAFKEAVAS